MRWFKTLLALVSVVVISCLIAGCISGLKSVKRSSTKAGTSTETGALAKPKTAGNYADPGDKSPDDYPPVYAPPPPPSEESTARSAFDLRLKDEIEASALEFAKNFSNVQHVKICYSKLFGGWYLFLYISKGKKISLQHYSWNLKNSEWEISHHFKELLRKDELKSHLKNELADEKCYILK